MKNLTRQFRRAMADDERNFLVYADITLSDNTVLNLTNTEIWSGGFSYEEAVSEDENFTAVGSVVIGSAEVVINNIYEEYSQYDFTNAVAVLYIGMQFEDRLEKIKIGTYHVDDTGYNGATIRLSLLDNIEQFDRPYSNSSLVYPATLFQIVQNACTTCGVTLANNSQTFPHYQYEIPTRPEDESLTFREVLSWCATIAGCFAKCNPNGELILSWFDTSLLDESASDLDGGTFNPWTTGDVYDGGTFNPWTTGDVYDGGDLHDDRNVHYITGLWSQNIAMDDVVITGVTAYVKDESENAAQDIIPYSTGTSGYRIEIENNDFITKTNAQTIVNWLGQQLIGLRFRKLNVSQLSDPSIDAGDVGIVIDRKQNIYRILITRVAFSIGGDQTIVCGAETPSRNNATKYTSLTKAYVESRKQFNQEKSLREQAIEQLEQAIEESSGLYTTIVTPQTGGNIYYLHDTPDLADAQVVWKMTKDAWAVTDDWQGTDAATTAAHKWNAGLTVDGTLIAAVLSANGVNADWINTGTLSFNRCNGGTITLGGNDDGNGKLELLNQSNTIVCKLDHHGIRVGDRARATSTFDNARGTVISTVGTITSIFDNKYFSVLGGRVDFGVYTSSTSSDDVACIYAYNNTLYLQCSGGDVACISNRLLLNNLVIAQGSTKSKCIESKNFGDRLLYCYEMPTPYFGDIGTGKTDETGEAIIDIDSVFDEGINTKVEYSVFLQKEGQGDIWIEDKQLDYFIVKGTPNLKFSWELKAVQKNFETYRMDDMDLNPQNVVPSDESVGLSMEYDLEQLDNEVLFEEVF